jgi:hypothetical protein
MAPEPYRQTYRVERRTRDLTEAERAIVDARVRDWDEQVRKRERRHTIELTLPLVVGVAAVLFGAIRGNGAVIFMGGLMGSLFAIFFLVAWRQAKARIAASRGPWHPPPDGYGAIETRVVARSVVGAISGDEDYACWLLFEIPGGDWFYLEATVLPDGDARAEVHLVRLAPHGPYLSAEARGDAIPRRGASGQPDDYAKAMDDGQVWHPALTPDEGEHDVEGRVAEAKLPAWVRAAAEG